MASAATPNSFVNVPEEAETWVDLASSDVKFNAITLFAQKGADPTINDSILRVRAKGTQGWLQLEPGTTIRFEAPAGSYYRGDQYEIYAQTLGDGVLASTASAVVYDGP